MKIIKTDFDNLFLIKNNFFKDNRGSFLKIFNIDNFKELCLSQNFEEIFYSISKKNVIRGMHFQEPPNEHDKIVVVIKGEILDVVLDIRKNSKTYGNYFSINLNSIDGKVLYVPKGFAHGFKSLKEDSIVMYLTNKKYSSNSDNGILWNSFGFDWDIENPIISNRDNSFKKFEDYTSKFN